MKQFNAIYVFIAALTLFYTLIGYPKIVFKRPQSIHQWAQCDRGSVALNFYQTGVDVLHPRTHNIENNSGISGMEFPLIQIVVAVLYRIFGFHEYLYRLVVFITFFTGVVFSFKLCRLFLHNDFLSAIPSFLIVSSPVLAYYALTFLPEAASLGLAFIAWYYFILQYKKKEKHTGKIVIFSMISALIKITSLINPAIMFLLVIANTTKEPFLTKLKNNAAFIVIPIFVFTWYFYAKFLNEQYHSDVFNLSIKPGFSLSKLQSICNHVSNLWWWRFYPQKYFIVLILSSIIAIYFKKYVNRLLLRITILLYIFSMIFFILMAEQFRHHDYYIIPLMPVLLFHWILLIDVFSKIKIKNARLILIASSLFILAYNISDSKDHLRTAYKKDSWKYGSVTFDAYFNIEKVLRSYHLNSQTGILSIYDYSPNISLYLMNQRGITVDTTTSEVELLKIIRNTNHSYAILNNFNAKRLDYVIDSLSLGKCIFRNDTLSLFKLTPEKYREQNIQ